MEQEDLSSGVEPESDSIGLGGRERTEQVLFHELGGHPRSVIRDLDDDLSLLPHFLLAGGHMNAGSRCGRGLEGVVKNAGERVVQVVRVTPDAGNLSVRRLNPQTVPASV